MSGLKPHQNLPDDDVEETDEWLESLRSVVQKHGSERARMLLHELMIEAEYLSIPINQISGVVMVQREINVGRAEGMCSH